MSDGQPRIVLLAEDDVDTAFFVCRELRKLLASWDVCHVPKGAAALERLARAPFPSVLVTDLHMPVMDGFELIEHVRAAWTNRSLPVFVLSSSEDPADQSRCERLGADGFFCKNSSNGGKGLHGTLASIAQRLDSSCAPALEESFTHSIHVQDGMTDASHLK